MIGAPSIATVAQAVRETLDLFLMDHPDLEGFEIEYGVSDEGRSNVIASRFTLIVAAKRFTVTISD